jgi:hypothetical protein
MTSAVELHIVSGIDRTSGVNCLFGETPGVTMFICFFFSLADLLNLEIAGSRRNIPSTRIYRNGHRNMIYI